MQAPSPQRFGAVSCRWSGSSRPGEAPAECFRRLLLFYCSGTGRFVPFLYPRTGATEHVRSRSPGDGELVIPSQRVQLQALPDVGEVSRVWYLACQGLPSCTLSASAAAMRIPIQRQFRGGHLGSFHSALRFPRDHRPASEIGLSRVFSWPFFGCDEAPCGNFRDVEIVPCHSFHPLAQRPGTPLAVMSHSSRVSHRPSTQAPPSIALVLLWLVGSFFTCTEIFIPSLPFTALSRAGVNFTSLHSLLLPTLFRIHFSIRPAKSFLTHRPPDSNSCSISPWS